MPNKNSLTIKERARRKRAAERRWARENREHVREVRRKYYQDHREEIREKQKMYYVKNRSTVLSKKKTSAIAKALRKKQKREEARRYLLDGDSDV
jgi:hypothetical protein